MDPIQEHKEFVTVQQRPPVRAKMLAATSTKPVRALILVGLIVLIYLFQPFTSPRQLANSAKASAHLPSSWPHWPQKDKSTMKDAADRAEVVMEAGEGGPRIRQATMIYETDKFNSVYERAVDSHINHGRMWNIPTHVLRHDIVDAGFFNKPAFLLGLVIQEMAKPYGQRADWIVWFDADTVILNPTVPWSIFLPPADFDDVHVLGSQDQNGFNAGMMLIRVHDWSVKMLSEVIALRQLRPEVEFPFYDQGATRWVCERPGYQEHMLYQPHDWWNAFGLSGEPYNTDRFMLHFAGVDCCGQPEKKTVVMGRWLDIVENHPEKHTVPLGNTTYPSQVEDYWKLLKTGKTLLNKANKYRDEKKTNPPELEKAQSELQNTMMKSADNSDKMTEAIKKLEGALLKEESGKSSEPAKDEKKEPTKSEDKGKKEDDKAKKVDDKGKKDDGKGKKGT